LIDTLKNSPPFFTRRKLRLEIEASAQSSNTEVDVGRICCLTLPYELTRLSCSEASDRIRWWLYTRP